MERSGKPVDQVEEAHPDAGGGGSAQAGWDPVLVILHVGLLHPFMPSIPFQPGSPLPSVRCASPAGLEC